MRAINYTSRFKRDYKREKSGRHDKALDAILMEVVTQLATDTPLPRRNFDHPLSGGMGRPP
jgi:mRNA interferase YafQ